jgi:hypothetical protein
VVPALASDRPPLAGSGVWLAGSPGEDAPGHPAGRLVDHLVAMTERPQAGVNCRRPDGGQDRFGAGHFGSVRG